MHIRMWIFLYYLPDTYEGHEFAKRKIEISGKLYDLSLKLGIDISPLILIPKIFYAHKTPFALNVVKDAIKLLRHRQYYNIAII